MQDLKGLLSERRDVKVGRDIDFGVVQTTPPATLATHQPLGGSLPDIVAALTSSQDVWELDQTLRAGDSALAEETLCRRSL